MSMTTMSKHILTSMSHRPLHLPHLRNRCACQMQDLLPLPTSELSETMHTPSSCRNCSEHHFLLLRQADIRRLLLDHRSHRSHRHLLLHYLRHGGIATNISLRHQQRHPQTPTTTLWAFRLAAALSAVPLQGQTHDNVACSLVDTRHGTTTAATTTTAAPFLHKALGWRTRMMTIRTTFQKISSKRMTSRATDGATFRVQKSFSSFKRRGRSERRRWQEPLPLASCLHGQTRSRRRI